MLVRTIVPNTEGGSFVSQQYIYASIIKTGHAQCVMCMSSPMLSRPHGGSNFSSESVHFKTRPVLLNLERKNNAIRSRRID